jgi:hypothetical protein
VADHDPVLQLLEGIAIQEVTVDVGSNAWVLLNGL